MNLKRRIAVLSFSPLQGDGRVLRQVEYLSQSFTVDVIGYGPLPAAYTSRARGFSLDPPTNRARRWRKACWLPLGRIAPAAYETWYWSEAEFRQALDTLRELRPDAIHANDWEALPVAVRAARDTGACVVSDLHEYAPLLRENRRYWRTFYKPSIEYFLSAYLGATAASVTVSRAIADRYRAEYGIDPIVVMNAPQPAPRLPFRPTDPEHIRLIHHGNAIRDRQLERMIETVALLPPRYSLYFMLVERDPAYAAELRALARMRAPGRVFFLPPVSPAEVVKRISEFDIGFYLMPALSFNQLAALPNKFFDFVMAGLAVCIGPSPEMEVLIRDHGFGLVAPDLAASTAARLLAAQSSSDIDGLKRQALVAREVLNADVELGKLLHLYEELLRA